MSFSVVGDVDLSVFPIGYRNIVDIGDGYALAFIQQNDTAMCVAVLINLATHAVVSSVAAFVASTSHGVFAQHAARLGQTSSVVLATMDVRGGYGTAIVISRAGTVLTVGTPVRINPDTASPFNNIYDPAQPGANPNFFLAGSVRVVGTSDTSFMLIAAVEYEGGGGGPTYNGLATKMFSVSGLTPSVTREWVVQTGSYAYIPAAGYAEILATAPFDATRTIALAWDQQTVISLHLIDNSTGGWLTGVNALVKPLVSGIRQLWAAALAMVDGTAVVATYLSTSGSDLSIDVHCFTGAGLAPVGTPYTIADSGGGKYELLAWGTSSGFDSEATTGGGVVWLTHNYDSPHEDHLLVLGPNALILDRVYPAPGGTSTPRDAGAVVVGDYIVVFAGGASDTPPAPGFATMTVFKFTPEGPAINGRLRSNALMWDAG